MLSVKLTSHFSLMLKPRGTHSCAALDDVDLFLQGVMSQEIIATIISLLRSVHAVSANYINSLVSFQQPKIPDNIKKIKSKG